MRRGRTGYGRGHAIWKTPELRAAVLAKRDRALLDRFDKFVIRQDGCWGWSGCHNGVGYGYLRVNKKLRLATHVSLELAGRPQPSADHEVCHRCDNPICTNPDHLFWGTHSQNMRDCVAKDRHYKTRRRTHCRRGHEFTPATELIDKKAGTRRCRICHNRRARERAIAAKGATA